MKLESKNNGFHIEGFIDITLEKEGGTIKQRFYNALSPAYKEAILASLASKLFMGIGYKCGFKTVWSPMLSKPDSSSYGNFLNTPITINNVLINDSNIVGVPSSVSKSYNTDLTLNNDVITGYANTSTASSGAMGQKIENQNKATRVSTDVVAAQWQYPEGVATGTITHIGMMCGVPNGDYGLRTIRCLDNFDLRADTIGNQSASSRFLPPGITGITGDYEVMTNGNDGVNSTHKINLNTGVVEDNPVGYKVFDTNRVQDYIVIGNYAYVVEESYLEIYELPNFTEVTYINIGNYSGISNPYQSKKTLFYDSTNNYLYLICGRNSSSGTCGAKLTNNGTYFTSPTAITDYTDLGLPFEVDPSKYTVKSLGSNKFCLIDILTNNSASIYKARVIGMSLVDNKIDLKNIIYPLYQYSVIAWVENTSTYYVFDIVDGSKTVYENSTGGADRYTGGYVSIMFANASGDSYQAMGVVYSAEEDCTQLLSLSALSTPIQKGANDTLYVTYGYRVV